MKKQVINLAVLLTMGIGLTVVSHPQAVHAEQQFYSVPSLNRNITQVNAGNALASYNDSDLTFLNNSIPNVPKPQGYVHTNLNMQGNNLLYSYRSLDNSTMFNTQFYLPEGFHVQAGEHGNYQSMILVGHNLYIVESMGTGTNRGAIVRYNVDDLRNHGIFDGNQDLLWKALNYFSPYTNQGHQHQKAYQSSKKQLKHTKRSVQKIKPALKKWESKIKPLQVKINKLNPAYQKAINAQRKFVKQVQHQQTILDDQSDLIAKIDALNKAASQSNTSNSSSSNDPVDTDPKHNAQKAIHEITNDNYLHFAIQQKNQIQVQTNHLNQLLNNADSDTQNQIKASLQTTNNLSRQDQILIDNSRAYYRQYEKIAVKINRPKDALQHVNATIGTLRQRLEDGHDLIDHLNQTTEDADQYYELAHLGQISPLINIGHGQTLSYNPSNQHLYLAQDDGDMDGDTNQMDQVTEIDPQSLQPVRQYNFQLLHNNVNFQTPTLTFDAQGNAYIGRKYNNNNGYQILKGRFTDQGVSFATEKTIFNRPGYFNQGLTYNNYNHRLYLISDDALTSFSQADLDSNTLNNNSFHYIVFNSHREFEDITFDDHGIGYLLMLWKPEVLKSDTPLN